MDEPSCPGCRQRDAIIARLQQQLATLTERGRVLEEQLQNNASNSSLPPSANPPQTPKPVVKQPPGKKPGGQPGHPPTLQRRLPPERLQRVIPFVPAACRRCGQNLPQQTRPDDPEPSWHQVAEWPSLITPVTEYQGQARTCPACHTVKGSFGSSSEGGCRFVERILTVVQTLRLQGRPVLTYLPEALSAHRKGVLAPKLLPAG
jgi:hypothetical protein